MWAARVSTYRRTPTRFGAYIAHAKHRSTKCGAALARAAVIAVGCAVPSSEATQPCGYHCAQGLAISIFGATRSYTQSIRYDSTHYNNEDSNKFQDDLSADDQELQITRPPPLQPPQSNVANYCNALPWIICTFRSSFLLQRPFEVPILGWMGGWVNGGQPSEGGL